MASDRDKTLGKRLVLGTAGLDSLFLDEGFGTFVITKLESTHMDDSRKHKLFDLGAGVLTDALLDHSVYCETTDDLIDRLIASPKESVQRFKKKLASLKRSTRFIDWRGSSDFARKLELLLQDLKSGVTNPLTGVELVAAFYETDGKILDRCDDSSGRVGDVFRFDAKEMFVEYATLCTEKEKIAEIILKLNRKDDYGLRDTLIYCAGEYLPKPVLKSMIGTLQESAEKEINKYDKDSHFRLIESLARQIKDAKLFEKTRIELRGQLSTAAFVDIARVYLESGDVNTAHSWLKKIPAGGNFKEYERDRLLLDIYQKQGDSKNLTELLYRNFRDHHSTDTLEALLDVIGREKRDEVIKNEITLILGSTELCESDAEFLISIAKIDEAEEYILSRAHELNGIYFGRLLSLAEAMESENRTVAASLIYRSLLISILNRGYSKAYGHGARYLRKLDKLAVSIPDWKRFESHHDFKEQIFQAHGRKRSFWSKYEVKK